MIPSFLKDNCGGTPGLYFSPCGIRAKKTALSFSQLCPQCLAHAWHVLSVWQFLSDGSIGSMLSVLLLWDPYGYAQTSERAAAFRRQPVAMRSSCSIEQTPGPPRETAPTLTSPSPPSSVEPANYPWRRCWHEIYSSGTTPKIHRSMF